MTRSLVLTLAMAAALSGQSLPSYTISTVAGTPPGAVSRLDTPNDLEFDTAGNMYISESVGGKVTRISPSGQGTVLATNISLAWGLAVAQDGLVYVCSEKRVFRVAPDGGITHAITEGQLAGPFDVALDAAGRLYIADAFGHRIVRREGDGSLKTIAGTGTAGFSGDGGLASEAQIYFPNSIRFDSHGVLWFTDTFNNRVRTIAPDGRIGTAAQIGSATRGLAIAPDGIVYFSADDGRVYRLAVDGVRAIAGSGEISRPGRPFLPPLETDMRPAGLAVDAKGRLFIADNQTQVIWTFLDDGRMTMVAGGAAIMPGTAMRLQYPAGLTADAAGNVYIADRLQHRVITLAPDGVASVYGLSADLWHPVGLAIGTGQHVVRGEPLQRCGLSLRVRTTSDARLSALGVTSPTGVAILSGTVFALDYGRGQLHSLPPGGAASTILEGLSSPWGLAATPDGNLLIADTGANRVLRVTPSGSGNPLPAPPDGYASPYGAAADAAGNVYVTDRYHHRVIRVAADGSIATIAGTGSPGYSGDGGLATAAQLDGPWGIAVTAGGVIYVSDTNNHRVRKLTPQR